MNFHNSSFLTKICFIIFLASVLTACGGGKASTKSDVAAEFKFYDDPLESKYDTIVVQKIDVADPKFATDYPTATADFENSLASELQGSNRYKTVLKQPGNEKKGVLLIQGKVVKMRIVSGAARFWIGAMAGSSEMEINIKLLAGLTGKVIREKTISSYNNAYGGAWTFGSSDRSLPIDMGRLAAAYVLTVAK